MTSSSRPARRGAAALAALTLAATGAHVFSAPAAPAAVAAPTVTDGCIKSVPEPGTTDKVDICWTMFKPAGASRTKKVPLVMHSHGWGGSRTTSAASFQKYLDAGFGVLSFDQRGFGESGGKAHVMNPAYEGQDVRGLVSLVAAQPWVRKDAPGDPRLGAIGGSYGGGYQFLGAFEQLRVHGKPIFDALAPEITWFDLKESLAPDEAVRTEWVSALSAASLPSDALPPEILGSVAEGAVTGSWPDGTVPGTTNLDAFFQKNGPKWHVSQGRRLDIPVLFGQGATDNLFPLRQGLKNWAGALTERARSRSIFVGYNGGHTLPSAFPAGVGTAGDPCSKKLGSAAFGDLALRFMQEKLQGKDRNLTGFGRFHLATSGGTCTTVTSVSPDRSVGIPDLVSTTVLGAPLPTEVAKGPIRIAGRSFVTGKVTTYTPDARAFLALAVGTSPTDARIVQNNMLPLVEPDAVTGASRRIELPSVAVDVPAGQSLFLVISPVADMFASHGSRVPGVVQVSDVKVELPTVG
jgi:ABC-2 type transport system ATP-binding protein